MDWEYSKENDPYGCEFHRDQDEARDPLAFAMHVTALRLESEGWKPQGTWKPPEPVAQEGK